MPPDNQSVIALDYGEKRVGVAIASTIARLATPLITLDNDFNLLVNLKHIIDENQVGNIVVGYPRGMDGQTTKQTEKVDQFIEGLKGLNLPIDTQDESLTSVHAEAELQSTKPEYSKADVDSLAATYILEDFLKR